MKVLFVTSPHEDYLADSLLIGLRELLGNNCIDYPKAEVLYKNHNIALDYDLYGKGFTLYSGILDDQPIDRFRIQERVVAGEFDLIIFGNIWNQYGYFTQLRPWLSCSNTVILDGADSPQPYPSAGFWWRRPYYWGLPRAHREFLYFKREWTEDTRFIPLTRLLPRKLREYIPFSKNLRQIAFSIPSEKIVKSTPEKTKDFPKHIVDAEVAKRVKGSATKYAFSNETEYYHDLQISRFGITTKRSGWDCLRHYEIAANGAVPCFKDLNKKPINCAPHGLDYTNSITYHSADDLFNKVKSIDKDVYLKLRTAALNWANQQTTLLRARELVKAFKITQSRV